MDRAFEVEARHHLRDVLMHVIDESMRTPEWSSWDVADALLDAGEITWNYRIEPKPQLATFQMVITASDAPGVSE